MQIHPRPAVRPFRHNARNQRDVPQVQLVGHALDGNGFDERVGHNDLLAAQRGRVAIVGGLGVGLEQLPQAGQGCEEFQRRRSGQGRQLVCGQVRRRVVFQAFTQLLLQAHRHALQQLQRLRPDGRRMHHPVVEKTGEQQAQQVPRDDGNSLLRRQVVAIQMVDAPEAGVGFHQTFGQARDS